MHPGKTIKRRFSFHDAFVFGVAWHLWKIIAGTGWLLSGVNFFLSTQASQGMRTQMCFISQGCHFCQFTTQEWQQSVLIRSVKEVLMSNLRTFLSSSRLHWAPLDGEIWAITTVYSHQEWIGCNWICTMALWWEKGGETGKNTNLLIFHCTVCTSENSHSFHCIVLKKNSTPQQPTNQSHLCSILHSFCSLVTHVLNRTLF